MKIILNNKIIIICFYICILFYANNSYALDFEKKIGVLSNLAMLSQKMSKEVLLIDIDFEKDRNIGYLIKSKQEFEDNFRAISLGSKKRKIKQSALPNISDIKKQWDLLSKDISNVIESGDVNKGQFSKIYLKNMELLRSLEEMIRSYTDTSKLYAQDQSQIKSFMLSGKLEMLSQKITKEYLLIALGKDIEINRSRLTNSVNEFDRIIDILMYGNVRHGVARAPSKSVFEKLREIKFQWKILRYKIIRVPSSENIKQAEQASHNLLREIEQATAMIEDHY